MNTLGIIYFIIQIFIIIALCWFFWRCRLRINTDEMIYQGYDLGKKRNYEIEIFDGSIIEVKEEDFWLNTRGCYDHGYVDPPVGYVDLKKYQNQDQDFFETKVVEYIDVYGGKGNSKIMCFERELESTRDRITNGVFGTCLFYEGNVMGKIYGKQIEQGLLCFHQVPLSDKSAAKKYLLSVGLNTNGEKITENIFASHFGNQIQKGG